MAVMGEVVTVTDAAAARARALLAKAGVAGTGGLKVTVQSSGCDGFAALLDIAAAPGPDEIVVADNGVRLFVVVPSMLRLPGAVLDHTTTPYGAEFTWTHPGCAPKEEHA
jgi:iron-sulfur cluster assembly protein